MSTSHDDLGVPAPGSGTSDTEGVRIDASQATPVSSGSGPVPPGRSRRGASQRRAVVSATAPVTASAPEAYVVEDFGDEEDFGRRSLRKERRAARRAATALGPATERRFHQTVTKVDLWSVMKLSLCFYLSAMFVTLVALIALWMVADAAGVIKSVEEFIGDLLSAKDFQFLSGEVLRGTILIGLVVVALQVVITVIAASFYNIFAELFGGIEITVKEVDGSR